MEFTDYKVPYPTLYVIDKGETDKTKGTALAVYPPAIGPFASEYAVSKEKHPSRFSAEITKEASVDATALSKRQKVCLLQSGTPKEGSPSSFPRHARLSASWRTPWHSSAPSLGEFSYISGYWEWVDDVFARKNKNLHRAGVHDAVWASLFTYDVDEHVIRTFCHLWSPSTNTLCTSVGEFSISLWDLHILGGLPLRGLFYDEVVPSAKELTGVDKDNKLFLPRSCQHLFSAYHHLGGSDSDGVQALDWVKFWFKGPIRYREPPQRLSKKGLTKPRLTYNPSGEIHTSLAHDRTVEENAPFDALGVKEPDREETYVAALLACWICRFLLPSRNINHIRPGVFKVASMIASGERFSLAIPVLASIYRGLKQLTSSTDLKECTAVFPIHYVYGWISSYLKTHFEREDTEIVRKSNLMRARMTRFAGERMARKYNLAEAQHIFESIEPSQMTPLPMFREKMQMLCDSGTSSDMEKDYFICLRSCYLVLRFDKHYIVEFYDPHRFGRQFGFSQDLPSGIRAEQNTS